MLTKQRATIDDLYNVDGKAELINGEIVRMSPTGDDPARCGGRIYISLDRYERLTHAGYAYPDNVAFRVNLPDRQSFSPDASFHTGPRTGMKFLDRAPTFAVEVRSENDYGYGAEIAMAAKRADYFAAGTLVVWDVDILGPDTVRVYRASAPDVPTIYRKGQEAEAEPALSGWQFPVDELFE